MADNRIFLQKLAKLESVELASELPMSAMHLVGKMEVHLPLAGFIDKDAEIARLDKEIAKLQQEIERTEKKLSNEAFVSKAPAEVVAKEQAKIDQAKATASKLKEQQEQLKSL